MADSEHRIRERAYQLWEEEGRPEGRDIEYWERARCLIGIEDNADAAHGQIPDRFADQGEKGAGAMRKPLTVKPAKPRAPKKKGRS